MMHFERGISSGRGPRLHEPRVGAARLLVLAAAMLWGGLSAAAPARAAGSLSFTENVGQGDRKTLGCELCYAWTWVSFNVIPDDPSLLAVLNSIDGQYDLVYSADCDGINSWQSGRPIALNDLQTLDPFHGFGLHVTEPGLTLTIDGATLPANTPLELCEGWNFISYLPNSPDTLAHALASIAGLYTRVLALDCDGAHSWSSSVPPFINDLSCLEPCKGYFVKMNQAGTLTYPVDGYECNVDTGGPVITPAIVTVWWIDYWSAASTYSGIPLEVGDTITAFDPDGVLCGIAVVQTPGSYLIHVYGDDPATPSDEGAIPGDAMTFYLNSGCAVTLSEPWSNFASVQTDIDYPCTLQPPVALCQDVTVAAVPIKSVETINCRADASIDDGSFDPDGGAVTLLQSPPGPYSLGQTLVKLLVTDDEGDTASCQATVTVEDIEPPVANCAGDLIVSSFADLQDCDPADVEAEDNCDGPLTVTCERENLGGVGCTDNAIPVTYTYTITDAAGNAVQCERTVTIALPDCPTMVVSVGSGAEAQTALIGTQVTVPVRVNTDEYAIGSFELLVGYDRSTLALIGVDKGNAIAPWEYFTYRLGTDPDCGEDCADGLVRLVAVADLDDGGGHPPEGAFIPLGTVAHLNFVVTSDADLAGRELLIAVQSLGCGNNTITSRIGNLAFVNPEFFGASCQGSHGGMTIIPTLSFESGLIRIVEPVDSRGDLNLNGMAYEVGDAILYTNYFIHGSSVWDPLHADVQILASDVNADGVVLSVGDLVYLIRVLTGDAQPAGLTKLSPYAHAGHVTYRVESGAMTVSAASSVDLGGALFVFRYSGVGVGKPALSTSATGLTLTSTAQNGELRILLATGPHAATMAQVTAGTHDLFTVPVYGDGRIELVETQMSDAQGAVMSTIVAGARVPESFALLQNYPNPFNAGTIISYALGDDGPARLEIFDILGRSVITLVDGVQSAGLHQAAWNGTERKGRTVSSGMYFYRLTAGDVAVTKKMLLLK